MDSVEGNSANLSREAFWGYFMETPSTPSIFSVSTGTRSAAETMARRNSRRVNRNLTFTAIV